MIQKSTEKIKFGDYNFTYQLNISPKRRTISIQVLDGGKIKVFIPYYVKKKDIIDYLHSKKNWIIECVEKVKHAPDYKLKYSGGENHLFLGKKYILTVLPANKKRIFVHRDSLVMHLAKGNIKNALENWYKEQAFIHFKKLIKKNLGLFEEIKKINKPTLKIRKMKRKWGSCSNNGVILLNYKLIKAPIACIEFVIIHELCHLIEFNHSKKFYHLLTAVLPDWKKKESELKKYTREILEL